MIIYEVNLKINSSITSQYLNWLQPHIKKMLKFPGFLKAELLKKSPEAGSDFKQSEWVVQYHVKDHASLQHYLTEHAEAMREDGINKFGKKFNASRRVLESVESY